MINMTQLYQVHVCDLLFMFNSIVYSFCIIIITLFSCECVCVCGGGGGGGGLGLGKERIQNGCVDNQGRWLISYR